MTSSLAGMTGDSFGWINRKLIASGQPQEHINVFGGEDRFWLGPEGGQYSIYFKRGSAFNLDNWYVPVAIDTMPYKIARRTDDAISVHADFELVNYSGAHFSVKVERTIALLEPMEVLSDLRLSQIDSVKLVAYESRNRLHNAGATAWRKETGLLSIWVLGMYSSSPATTVIIPFNDDENIKAPVVNDAYFGEIPSTNLKIANGVVFFKGDGKLRGKLGLHPDRATGIVGSYDAARKMLTLVTYTAPKNHNGYVNSMWELQEDPYDGDVVNSYNDGPPAPGAPQLGAFYEIETSSPAAALAPEESLLHIHRTVHMQGEEEALNQVAGELLGVNLANVADAFSKAPR